MLDGTFASLEKTFEIMEIEMRRLFVRRFNEYDPKRKRHRIISKGGHIEITGTFKSLTVNGKKVE